MVEDHCIVGPIYSHLLDPSKVIDSLGNPILEILNTSGNTNIDQARTKFIYSSLNECLEIGLPSQVSSKLLNIHLRKQKKLAAALRLAVRAIKELNGTTCASTKTNSTAIRAINEAGKALMKANRTPRRGT